MNQVPLEVWADACYHAEQAHKVTHAYDRYFVWHFPSCNLFAVAAEGAGVIDLAHAFIHRHVESAYTKTAAAELLRRVDQLRQAKGAFND